MVSYQQLTGKPVFLVTLLVKRNGKFQKAGSVRTTTMRLVTKWMIGSKPSRRVESTFLVWSADGVYYALGKRCRLFMIPKELIE